MPRFCDTIASFWFMLGSHQPSNVGISHIYTGKVCGFCLWILSMRSPELLTSVWVQRSLSALRRKDLPLYTYSLALYLDIAAFLLQCCGLFGMECVNWVLGRKQGLKMQFFYLAAIRMNWIVLRSLLFVDCGHMCFYVCYVWYPKSVSFAGCEGGVIFFFRYTAYQQPWRGLSAKCSNTGCSYKKGPKHCQFMGCLDNPMNSFQLRSG